MDIDRFLLKNPGLLPFVGIFIGIILVITNLLLDYVLSSSIISEFLVMIMILMTGFKNINGFVNTIGKLSSKDGPAG